MSRPVAMHQVETNVPTEVRRLPPEAVMAPSGPLGGWILVPHHRVSLTRLQLVSALDDPGGSDLGRTTLGRNYWFCGTSSWVIGAGASFLYCLVFHIATFGQYAHYSVSWPLGFGGFWAVALVSSRVLLRSYRGIHPLLYRSPCIPIYRAAV